ncbi:hypothetical protein C8A00DRAFT_38315 [Chaetomidium leptoderma]|uniref:2EXR domain-containing protein n=1 Tax=Chaetomidium leptoderma TaxID=669021 RepID=A0AAN6VCU3_9PEZI|nr:hypothetical protein C8A00DRAFT_38315 [Chaetomidium leptoderma]
MDQQGQQKVFKPFPRLPLELQVMVWAASIEPRLVEVNMVHRSRPRAGRSKISWRGTPNPVQLRVSVEARRVVLRFYQKVYFACPVANRHGIATPEALVYFHPRMDVLGQDFEAIIKSSLPNRVRRPGVRTRLIFHGDFDAVFKLVRPLPRDFLDPLRDLRHVHLNLHILKSSSRNHIDRRCQTVVGFISSLVDRAGPNPLQTITARITVDMTSPPTPADTQNLLPIVYRIVRRPSLPALAPSVFFSGIRAAMHLVALCGLQPAPPPPFLNILLRDGAVFTTIRENNNFVALRVIDPTSNTSEIDDYGRRWLPYDRERLWCLVLAKGAAMDELPIITWLSRFVSNPWAPHGVSPWGICGVNYGMGEARVYSHPTAIVDWNWP